MFDWKNAKLTEWLEVKYFILCRLFSSSTSSHSTLAFPVVTGKERDKPSNLCLQPFPAFFHNYFMVMNSLKSQIRLLLSYVVHRLGTWRSSWRYSWCRASKMEEEWQSIMWSSLAVFDRSLAVQNKTCYDVCEKAQKIIYQWCLLFLQKCPQYDYLEEAGHGYANLFR